MIQRRLCKGVIVVVLLGGCTRSPEPQGPSATATPVASVSAADTELHKIATSLFKPLPGEMSKEPLDKNLVDLGRRLYYEKRLSGDGTMSCNTCHDLKKYGVDGQPTSLGVTGHRGSRNSPTVYNAASHIAQFWDGRSPNVEDQAKGPVTNPVEMAVSDEKEAGRRLREIADYREPFARLFAGDKEPVSLGNAAIAIGAFERGLVTPGRFDAYLKGDLSALDRKELVGLKTFVDSGCASCHNGADIGGGQYQKLGVKKPYPTEDVGRFAVTGKEGDKNTFKVPGLRNIRKTGPYFHNGSLSSLNATIEVMGEYQLDKKLSAKEVQEISDFLGCLTGKIPEDYIKEPTQP